MELITGLGSGAHIDAIDDAMWHRGIWPDDGVVPFGDNLQAQIQSNNEIRIQSGIAIFQGRFFAVRPGTYDSVTIQNGTQGEKRTDLIVARYTKAEGTGIETMEWVVLQGTPAASDPQTPAHTEGNIDNGDLTVDYPCCKVNIDGINITSVENLLPVLPTLSGIKEALYVDKIQVVTALPGSPDANTLYFVEET